MSDYYKYIKYKTKYTKLKNLSNDNLTGGGKKAIQFILFGDVMTGHNVWFTNRNGNKINFVKKLKKIGDVIILKPNYVNFMNFNNTKKDGNWYYKSGIKNNYKFTKEDLYFENYSKWVYNQIDKNKKFIAFGLEQGAHFAKYFCNQYSKNCIALYVLIDRNFTKKSYERTFHSEMNYDFIKSVVGDDYEKYLAENITNETINNLLDKITTNKENEDYVGLLNGICKGIIRSQYDKIKKMDVKTIIYSDSRVLNEEKIKDNEEFSKKSNGNVLYYYIIDNSEYLIHGKYANEIYYNIYGLVKV